MLTRPFISEYQKDMCYHYLDYISSVCALIQIVAVIRWVSVNCREIEQMQRDELLLVVSKTAGFRINSMLSLNLDFLWDRISRFQAFLFSVLFSVIMWLTRTVVFGMFAEDYSLYGDCQIIYGLVAKENRVYGEEESLRVWVFLSVMTEFVVNMMISTFPFIFILIILESTLIKKR